MRFFNYTLAVGGVLSLIAPGALYIVHSANAIAQVAR